MIPVVSLIGRKNVGKSTLFNRLTCTYDALVASSCLGLTRDRRYGVFMWKRYQAIIADTGGIEIVGQGVESSIFYQSRCAVLEADLVLFVVDGKIGLTPFDHEVIDYLYKFQKSVFVVVNKIDISSLEYKKLEFYSLGFEKVISVSAAHGFGIQILLEEVFLNLFHRKLLLNDSFLSEKVQSSFFLKNPSYFLKKSDCSDIIVLSVVGSPNVGKSTFINCVLGENRVVVSDFPGTTRDSVCVSIIYNGHRCILIDTAGLRKKNTVNSVIEKISISKTLRTIQNSTIVLLLISADCDISTYNLSLLNSILRSGKSLVIGINKWDLLSSNLQKKFRMICNLRMHFVRFVEVKFISALYGDGISDLLDSIIKLHNFSLKKSISTSFLNNIMNIAVNKCQPPRVYGRQVKLKYAHIGGYNPLIVVIHGNYVSGLPKNYKKYLVNFFSNMLKISNFSIHILFKEN